MFPAFNVFGREIPVYGLLMVLGAVAAWGLTQILTVRKKLIKYDDVSLTFIIGFCGGITGAALLRPVMKSVEIAFNWDKYKAIPFGALFTSLFGELVFFGGVIGGLLAVLWFCRRYKLDIINMLDLFAVGLPLGHAIGRMGCYFGGCCYGMELPHGHPLAIIYPPTSLGAPAGVPLLAVPLIEAGFLALLAVVLSFVYLKTKKPGISLCIYFLAYSAQRFTIEFFRGDLVRGVYGWFTTSQYISMAMFLAGVYMLVRLLRKPKPAKEAGE